MAAALSRVYAGLCLRDRLTSKECPFWFYSLFCAEGDTSVKGFAIVPYIPISFPEHARSQVKGGHSSGEIEMIHVEFPT